MMLELRFEVAVGKVQYVCESPVTGKCHDPGSAQDISVKLSETGGKHTLDRTTRLCGLNRTRRDAHALSVWSKFLLGQSNDLKDRDCARAT